MQQVFDYQNIRTVEKGGQVLYFLNDALEQLGILTNGRKHYYHSTRLIRPDDVTERLRRKKGQVGDTGYYVPKAVLYRALFIANSPEAVELQNYIIDIVAPAVIEEGQYCEK